MPGAVKRRMSGEDRRSQIVKVASSLFATRGFKGATTREIAAKAGISEAVIFRHFSRKEDLFRAIIDARCATDGGESRIMRAIGSKTGMDAFREVAKYLLDEHSRDPSFMRLLLYSALEKQDLSDLFIRTRGTELLGFLEGRIRELIASGDLRRVDASLAARAFIGMVLHYSMAQEIYGLKKKCRHPNATVADVFVDIFFNGVRKG